MPSAYSQLMEHRVECPLGSQPFIPLSSMDIIDKKIIKNKLPLLIRCFCRNLPDKIVDQARKIFTILIFIGKPDAIHSMMREGLADEHLPLSTRKEKPYNVLVSRDGRREFRCFTSWEGMRIEDFLSKQWVVLAPLFDDSSHHIEMNKNCALPLFDCERVAEGIFAVVYKAKIYPDHHKGFNADGSDLQVAVKEFKTEATFEKEKENLRRIQSLKHKHLVNVIATCKRDRFYYVIFPWAEGGNLGEFWEKNNTRRSRDLTLWSLNQMLGLCEGLQALHHENCRHGDLKPENILHFKDEDTDPGDLVIADVGVSKFHNKATGLRQDPTDTRATTPIYEAPEAQPDVKEPRSRRYDMWSMGCMFLEFTVWLLYGHDVMRQFRSSRKSVDPEIRDGSFYRRSRGSGQNEEDDLLHLEVVRAFRNLRKHPSCQPKTALGDLLNIISENLIVHVDRRLEATELVDQLGRIVAEAKRNPKYLHVQFDDLVETRRFLEAR